MPRRRGLGVRNRKLLVNGRRLRFGKEFLKPGIIPDWVPDRVDLQTRDGNIFSGRGCEQLAKHFYSFFGPAGVRFDFRDYLTPFPNHILVPAGGGTARGILNQFTPMVGVSYTF